MREQYLVVARFLVDDVPMCLKDDLTTAEAAAHQVYANADEAKAVAEGIIGDDIGSDLLGVAIVKFNEHGVAVSFRPVNCEETERTP